jgi:dihydroneopterin aldolase
MNDIVFIEELKVDAILGILPQERITPQPVVIDLQLQTDSRPAASSKDINDTLDYSAVAEQIKALTINGEYLLIETLINDIADLCLRSSLVTGVTVEVRKPQAVSDAIVGLRIYRAK